MKTDECIITYTGIRFNIANPNADDIYERDIAHALSLTCRANGHFKHFYSVAQHSIHCAEEAKARGFSKRVQLACLLHDGSEAYISDITRPAKQYLPQYRRIEQTIQQKVYKKFGLDNLTDDEIEQVGLVDDLVLHLEFEGLHHILIEGDRTQPCAPMDFRFKAMQEVEEEFVKKLYGLLSEDEQVYTVEV